MRKIMLVFLLLFAMPVFAETTGVINLGNVSVSVTTGFTGYTVNLCNTTSDCLGHKCFNDYDSFSSPGSSGWCNTSVITSCYHNNSERATGTVICLSNVTYSTCTTGNWSAASSCSSGATCPSSLGEPGNCSSSSSSGSSGGSGGTSIYIERNASLIFTSTPLDFDIIQGESKVVYASVKNNGNLTLYNITLDVSGASWYTVNVSKVSRINTANNADFALNFSPPENADVKAYLVTLTANTNNASIHPSKGFTINVKPSNKTINEQIIPGYEEYLENLTVLEAQVAALQAGAGRDELTGLIANAENKLNDANRSIQAGSYFEAQQQLNEAGAVMDVIKSKLSSPAPTLVPGDTTFMIVIGVIIVAVAGVLVYLLLPPKKPTSGVVKGWISSEKDEGVLGRLRKKKR